MQAVGKIVESYTPPPLWAGRLRHADAAESLILLFEELAAQEGWQYEGELRRHVDRSVYLGLYHRDGEQYARLIGGLQLVLPDRETRALRCHKVWAELTNPCAEGVAHAAVLAVAPEWRGRSGGADARLPAAFWTLCAALWRHCLENGITEIWLEATPVMLRCYRLLGWPLVVQGELRAHWGEPCYPCKLCLREVAGSLAEKAARSALYRDIFLNALDAPRIK